MISILNRYKLIILIFSAIVLVTAIIVFLITHNAGKIPSGGVFVNSFAAKNSWL